jgi:hypothetical protein
MGEIIERRSVLENSGSCESADDFKMASSLTYEGDPDIFYLDENLVSELLSFPTSAISPSLGAPKIFLLACPYFVGTGKCKQRVILRIRYGCDLINCYILLQLLCKFTGFLQFKVFSDKWKIKYTIQKTKSNWYMESQRSVT